MPRLNTQKFKKDVQRTMRTNKRRFHGNGQVSWIGPGRVASLGFMQGDPGRSVGSLKADCGGLGDTGAGQGFIEARKIPGRPVLDIEVLVVT